MIANYSVRKPLTVAVCVVLVLILGVTSFTHMTSDLLPGMDLPYVAVITTYIGASPESVELSVTKPLEQALATTGGAKNITSTSSENSSFVILEFENGTNMDSAIIEMNGSINQIQSSFDDGVGAPILMKIDPGMLPIMIASVDYDGMDVVAISKFTTEVVIPALEKIDGVASVSGSGLLEKQLRITLDQDKIDALNSRVLASVDSGLAEAEAELKKARAELERGKKELEDKTGETVEKLAAAESQLTSGEAQVGSGSAALDLAEKQLRETMQELIKQRETIQKLIDQRKAIEDKMGDAPAQMNQLRLRIAANEAQARSLQGQITQKQAQIDAYTGEPEGLATLQAELLTLQTELAGTQAVIADDSSKLAALTEANKDHLKQLEPLDEQMYALGASSTADLENRVAQLDQSISASRTSLNQILAQKGDLKDAQEQLESGRTELEQGKATLNQESAKAAAQLVLAEAQLDHAEKELDANRDAAYKAAGLDGMITQTMISQILTAENLSLPAGYISDASERYMVKVGDRFSDTQELEALELFSVEADGIGAIRLSDVADIELSDNSEDLYARINGNDGVILSMQKQSVSSTAEVSDKINKRFAELTEQYPGLHITGLSDQGIYIDMVVGSVLENLAIGGLLAVAVLLVFLRNYRPTLVVAVSIPISLLFALVLMYFSGVTLNVISLSGLALGVGMLVDNSIVVIENIFRMRQLGVSSASAAVYGTKQVAGAITASTLTTACVFAPILFTQGLTRQIFADMGLTITYSLCASLLVAMTVVPALSSSVLGGSSFAPAGGFFDKLDALYSKALGWVLDHKAPVCAGAVALLLVSAAAAFSMGTAYIPDMDSPQISVGFEMPEGSTRMQTREMSEQIIERIMQIEGVDTIGAIEGGGLMSSGSGDISMYVLLRDDKKQSSQQISKEILERTSDLDCTVSASGSAMDLSAMSGSGIEVAIKGDDMDTLQGIAARIAAALAETPGAADIDDGSGFSSGEVRIIVDKNEALKYSLTVAQVFQQVAERLSTESTATTLTMGSESLPVIVAAQEEKVLLRSDLDALEITGAKGGEECVVRLGDIADITDATSPTTISRENQVRTLSVTAAISDGYNIGLVSRGLQKELDSMDIPDGYTVEITGENENINEALTELVKMVLLAIAFIYLVMVAQFQSLLSPFIVLFTIPLAFTGGLLALWITGKEISIISMMGFLVLAGIVVNNGIVFVDYTNQLRIAGADKRGALIKTGRDRLRPILMTALTTIFGLVTMAFGLGSGGDMVQPMAIVTIGGLAYATLLTLFIVPSLYDWLFRKEIKTVEIDIKEVEIL